MYGNIDEVASYTGNYAVAVTASCNGTDPFMACPTPTESAATIAPDYYRPGITVTLNAPSASPYSFVGWVCSGAGCSSGGYTGSVSNPSFTMPSSPITETAYYNGPWCMQGGTGSGGSMSPSGLTCYALGTQASILASPSSGYNFGSWATSGGNGCSWTSGGSTSQSAGITCTGSGTIDVTALFSCSPAVATQPSPSQASLTLVNNCPPGSGNTCAWYTETLAQGTPPITYAWYLGCSTYIPGSPCPDATCPVGGVGGNPCNAYSTQTTGSTSNTNQYALNAAGNYDVWVNVANACGTSYSGNSGLGVNNPAPPPTTPPTTTVASTTGCYSSVSIDQYGQCNSISGVYAETGACNDCGSCITLCHTAGQGGFPGGAEGNDDGDGGSPPYN